MEKLLKQLADENKELRRKLKKSEKRNRNLTNKVRKLKGLDKRGSLGSKKHNHTSQQTNESLGNIRHVYRGTGVKFHRTGPKLHIHGRDGTSDL
jgi:predicted RNase H-like nuclease (RuvC/YqgF family)